jgi:hypothetical protein
MAIRSLCIHGHFYQPPREDPLNSFIPQEVGAAPYQNWNERIHAECYSPNAELGNFERISFNVGPTLFEWIESFDPLTYQRILAQDRANLEKYGVGNAMAQAYNHTILPLANLTDKRTQVKWGIADFTHRFGRKPQGMWLPETAVDTETLSVLAEQGIQFTILAPSQALIEQVNTTEPYRVNLGDGKSVVVFFYNSELSSLISFVAEATTNADAFIKHHLLRHFDPEKTRRGEPQLVLLASDGELFGHHKPYRDRFLAYLVNQGRINAGIQGTYPALWLKDYKPRRSVEIQDGTSWSCHHGISRWTGKCDCTPGKAKWKTNLRQVFNRLAEALENLYLETVSPFVSDPLALRDRYIEVMLGQISAPELIHEMVGKTLPSEITQQISLLLEAQQERQRMFTSCGWYFEDLARIEPKNNIAYAAQAIRLTYKATNINLAPLAASDLQYVLSNRSELRGDDIFWQQYNRAEAENGASSASERVVAA